VLQKTYITVPLLRQTMIGKTLSKIQGTPDDYFEDKAIKEVTSNLLNTWKQKNQVYKDNKEKKERE
jgi:hypothetical protein